MINKENYYDKIKDIDFSTLPEALRKSRELVDKITDNNTSWAKYDNNPTFHRIVDLYFEELSHALKKEETEVPPAKKEPETKAVAEPKPKNNKPAVAKKEAKLHRSPKEVLNPYPHLTITQKPKNWLDEKKTKSRKKPKNEKNAKKPAGHKPKELAKQHLTVAFIKRYANLHGKTVTEKRIDQLLASLQKAILEKRIRKTDPHADLIHKIQQQLIILYKKMGATATVSIEDIDKYKSVGASEKQLMSIKLLKRYAGLLAHYDKEKAEILHDAIHQAIITGKVKGSDIYFNHLSLAQGNLHEAVTKSGKLEPTEAELNGLKGIDLWPVVIGYMTGRAVDKVFDTAVHHSVKAVTKHTTALKKKPKKFHVLGCADIAGKTVNKVVDNGIKSFKHGVGSTSKGSKKVNIPKKIKKGHQTFVYCCQTTKHIYFVDYNEGDDNGNVLMYDKQMNLVSDNYFANVGLFEDVAEGVLTAQTPRAKKEFELWLKENGEYWRDEIKKRKSSGLGCAGKICTCHQAAPAYSGLGNVPVQYAQQPVQAIPYNPPPISYLPPKPANRMSVSQAISSHYELFGLDGAWLSLIGEACKPTSFFIHGPGGSGKSTLTLMFANYMAQKGNKVLYVAGEQFGTPVFARMLQRLNIADSPYFVIAGDLVAESPANFDIVVLDSKDSLAVELPQFLELKKKYPKQSFIVLSQATKDGNFTGSEKWRNEVDTMIVCERGVAYTNRDKNRWGGAGEMRVF